jgi:MFS family permease
MAGSIWRERDYVRYWAASMISTGGSQLTYVAMPVLVFTRTGSPFLTSLVVAAEAIAYVAVGLVAGTVADRTDRKRLMVVADGVNAVVLGSLPVAAAFGSLHLAHIFAAVAVCGIATVFFDAADFASLPLIAGRDRLAAASSALTGPQTVLSILTPGVAGALLAVLAPSTVVAIDALSFVAGALLLRSITTSLSGSRGATAVGLRGLVADTREGLAFLWRHPTIRPMTLMSFAHTAYGGALLGQFVPLAATYVGAARAGSLASVMFLAFGVGAFTSSLLLPRLSRVCSAGWIALLSIPLSALGGLACALAGSPVAVVVAVGAWAIPYTLNTSNNIIFRQANTPEPLLSRVNAVGRMLAWGLGTPLGAAIGGAVAASAGPARAVGLASVVGLAAVALGWSSALRRQPLRPAPPGSDDADQVTLAA